MPHRPWSVSVAALAIGLQGLGALGSGVYVGMETVLGEPHDVASSAMLAVLAVLGGLGMLIVGYGLSRLRRWSRAPAVLTQVIALPVALSMLEGGLYAIGAPLLSIAIVSLLALFAPATNRAFAAGP